MATVQDLKRRIRSVRNTRKITRAMELVAAAKLRRAEQRITALRPYAETMNELIAGVGRAASSVRLPLLEQRESVETVAIVPLTGDRGLAGVVQRADHPARVRARAGARRPRARPSAGSPSGRRGARRSPSAAASSSGAYIGFTDRPAYEDAQAIAHRVAELFTAGEVDRVVLVYNTYVSALTQRVTEQDILPISADILETDEEERADDTLRGDFIFEPEPEEILERLLPVYLETQIYRALLESTASEQGARMTAMRNASKNAGELIDSLTLQMNRARQAEITQEILEVVAGAEALVCSARDQDPLRDPGRAPPRANNRGAVAA